MHKTSKILIVLAFAAFAAAIFVTRTNANINSASPTAVSDERPSTRDLYIRNCARCHGADGAGATDVGRKLEVPNLIEEGKEMSAAKIARVITKGKDEMPGFSKKLTKKQISSLAAYVRKL